ncbi:MAG: amidase family protein [Paracoccaceae bacterium]
MTDDGITRRDVMKGAASLAALAAAGGAAAQSAEPHWWTLTEAVAQLSQGAISPEEYATALLDRAETLSDLGAYITLDREATLAAARAAEGPLAGAGLAIKDNIDTADMPTSGGTPALEGRQTEDAAVIAKLRAAGGVVLGKANLHELAFGITSNNAHFGPARNPWNTDMIPGGSSGGVAVAVATGMAPAGLGTDTGGSCRIPAALCGVVGFRPTTLRWAQGGIVPISSTRDTAGPLARSVADARLLDSLCADQPAAEAEATLAGRVIGVPRPVFYDNLEPGVAEGMEAALALLEAEGATLREVEVADLADLSAATGFPIALYEVLREMSAYLYQSGSRRSVLDVVDQVAGAAEQGALMSQVSSETAIPAGVYQAAMGVYRPRLQAAFATALDGLDALVVPSTALTARPIGQEETVELNGEQVPTFATYIRNADPTAVAGLPCLSVPGGRADGMPFGVEFVGRAGEDGLVLALGEAFETARGTFPRPPV